MLYGVRSRHESKKVMCVYLSVMCGCVVSVCVVSNMWVWCDWVWFDLYLCTVVC